MAKIGSFSNPYSYSTYQNMSQDQTWHGGWVDKNNKLVYITTNGNEEIDMPDAQLGSEYNPFSSTAYNEMLAYETWVGGFVRQGNDNIYIPAQGEGGSGCGCGCGCGSGEGCGCGTGLIAGQAIYRPDVFPINQYFEISWGSGVFKGEFNPPSLTVSFTDSNNSNNHLSFTSSWENAFRVKIYVPDDVHSIYNYFFDIPQNYCY